MMGKDPEDRVAKARPPVPEGDETELRARSRARSLLRAEIAQASERHRPSRRRRLVVRGALVAIVAAAVTLIGLDLGLPGKAGKGGPAPAAAATLKQFANLVAGAPDEPLQPGQYYYLRTLTGSGRSALKTSTGGYRNAAEEELWIGTDGSGRTLSGGVDERYRPTLTVDNGNGPEPKLMPLLRFQGVDLSYRGLLSLPTQPSALLRWLQSQTKNDGPEKQDVQLAMIAELLGRTPAPPALRATLYRVIDGFPGTRSEGRVRDPLGRVGVGFVRHMAGCKLQPEATCAWEIILDPDTGNWLASRRTLSNGGPNWVATVATGIVTSVLERP